MKMIKPYDLFKVASIGKATCLSIYVNSPDQINALLAEAKRVGQVDLDESTLDELLAPVRYLVNSKKWQSNLQPTGIFVMKGFSGFMKLPFATKNLAVISKSFHVKPLLKWLQREKPFFLLHLDQKNATLFQGSLSEIKYVEKFELKKSRTVDFALDLVSRSLLRTIQRTHQPLILSGEPRLTEAFKNISSYKMLLPESIFEDATDPNIKALHQSCIAILKPYLQNSENILVKKYWAAKNRGAVTSNLKDIVSLAIQGQIKHLFVHETTNIWGQIDLKNGTFKFNPRQMNSQDDDVLDDLAEIVLLNRGRVTVLPGERMPEGGDVAAILKSTFAEEVRIEKPKVVKDSSAKSVEFNKSETGEQSSRERSTVVGF